MIDGSGSGDGFQVSVSSLSLGTLYEAIRDFSTKESFDQFWPAVCANARWIFPTRRMCVLEVTGDELAITGTFESGKFLRADESAKTSVASKLGREVLKPSPQWLTADSPALSDTSDAVGQWFSKDPTANLLALPVSIQGRNIAALLFGQGDVNDGDRTMLTALGTVYALHVGMAHALIRIAEARRESEQRYEMVFQHSNDGIFLVAADGCIVESNKKGQEQFGYSKAEMSKISIFHLHPERDKEASAKKFASVFKKGSARFEIQGRKKSGEEFPVEISASMFELEGTQVVHALVRDITELKQTMLELREKNEALEKALTDLRETQRQLVDSEKMAALGGLVAGIAHEINTPVGIGVTAASHLHDRMNGVVELYRDGKMKRSDFNKFLETANQSSDLILSNLNRAVEIIGSFKQVAVDQSSESRRSFGLAEYINEVLVSLRPRLKKVKHEVTVDCDPEITLDSYPGALAQIITNLVMNSLIHAYGEDDAGRIRFDVQDGPEDVVIAYSDDGAGIPAKNLNKIFEPFFTTRRKEGGSGLGMHIVYNLVTQRLNGEIKPSSTPGEGARFEIRLPKTMERESTSD